MNSIREWLNGSRNFAIGVALYECHGSDDMLKQVFAQGHSPYRQGKLVEAMRALLKNAQEVTVDIPEEDEPVTVIIPQDKSPESVPAAEDPYRDKWLPHFQQMQFKRARLRLVATDEERGNLAFEILDHDKMCRYWWQRRDYWRQYRKEMPDDHVQKPDIVTDRNELRRRLNNVRTYITKKEKRLLSHPLDSRTANRLEELRKERDDLEKQLDIKHERPADQRTEAAEPEGPGTPAEAE